MLPISEQELINSTKNWIEKVVLGLNLCPFAHLPFQKGLIRFRVIPTDANIYDDAAEELNHLQGTSSDELETTVMILPEIIDFHSYLNLVDHMIDLLIDHNLEGIIQIATFHPDYQFEGTEKDDITNCTNRSPYPLIHLLRESSVTDAVQQHPDIHSIPDINKRKLLDLGWEAFHEILHSKP